MAANFYRSKLPSSILDQAAKLPIRLRRQGWLQSVSVVFFGFVSLLCPLISRGAISYPTDEFEFFETKIRPLLVQHCYECHNSTEQAESGVALDYRGGFRSDDGDSHLLDFLNPKDSYLLQLMRHEVEGLEMPHGRPKLSQQILDDFERWIDAGAPDPRLQPPSAEQLAEQLSWPQVLRRRLDWWCYQPIKSTVVQLASPHASAIDLLIRQELQRRNLEAAPSATPEVLVRRLYLTLLGLPPSTDEAKQWTTRLANDHLLGQQTAYIELVDSLLSRPQFGERWARHWMDWIRYAESHGSEGDPQLVNAHHYRDYLIRALNQDLPFDQLVREHIAGDLLDQPRLNPELNLIESNIATAHWRMVFHGFAPTDALDEQVRFTDDQINVISKAFLGLTVSCARCHDHKFDAIGQDDYYALYGILNSTRAGRQEISYQSEREAILRQLEQIKLELREALAADWVDQLQQTASQWEEHLTEIATVPTDGRQDTNAALPRFLGQLRSAATTGESISQLWQQRREQRTAADQAATDFAEVSIQQWLGNRNGLEQRQPAGQFAVASTGDRALTGIYPAGWYSHDISDKLPARLTSLDIELTAEQAFWLQIIGDGQASVRYSVRDYPRDGTVYPVARINGNQWRWQNFAVSYWTGDTVHLEFAHAQDAPLLVADNSRSWFGIRRAILLAKDAPPPQFFDDAMAAVLDSISPAPDDWDTVVNGLRSAFLDAVQAFEDRQINDQQVGLLQWAFQHGLLSHELGRLPNAANLVARYRELEESLAVPIRVPGLVEAEVRNHPLFLRGDHRQPDAKVPRRFLTFLDSTPYPDHESGRRQLAEDLLRLDNPLTRRVIVNRLWHHLFGRGIVATTDNFGQMGTEPTHPELLDWLAERFSSVHGWSLKQAIREIVLSQTWQQSSQPTLTSQQVDPTNLYLSHYSFRRLEAEAIRDSLWQVPGLLDSTLYGPSRTDSEHNRRAIYSAVRRNALDPFLRTFDFPEPATCVGTRDATQVPAQSLTLLNDPLVQRSASALAQGLLADPNLKEADARISELIWHCFQRPPHVGELEMLHEYLLESKSLRQQTVQTISTLKSEQQTLQNQIDVLLSEVRLQIAQQHNEVPKETPTAIVEPIASWDFGLGLDDQVGTAHARVSGSVAFEQGAAIFAGDGYLETGPLPTTLSEKTLEAWVRVTDLNQRGGGVLSVQTANGNLFDAMVFGERDPGQWMSGSDLFNRTQGFNAEPEMANDSDVVHVAITYDRDGLIRAYRNGQPYGTPYRASSPIRFEAGKSIVTIGLRHLPAGGNRHFHGHVYRARVYSQALTEEEVKSSFQAGPHWISRRVLLDAMTPKQIQLWTELQATLQLVSQEVTKLQKDVPGDLELAAWTELVHSLILTQEFLTIQ